MKSFFKTISVLIIILAIIAGIIYSVDMTRMADGKEVLFSTWGRDYTPAVGESENKTDSPEKTDSANDEKMPDEEKDNKDIPSEVEVKLYFADSNIVNLIAEKRSFKNDTGLAQNVVNALIQGSSNSNLFSLIPEGTKVLSAQISNGVCTVDFSGEFVKFTGGTSLENLAVHSVVNTLCSIDGVNKVKINVEGNKSAIFGSHYSLEEAFSEDMSLVK